MEIIIKKSDDPTKKFQAIVPNKALPKKKIVNFGAAGYSDYTKHNDDERKDRYIARHKKNEQWGKSGIGTAGYYSRWVLWNKKTVADSIDNMNKKYKNIHLN
jgi:hypothetical protein